MFPDGAEGALAAGMMKRGLSEEDAYPLLIFLDNRLYFNLYNKLKYNHHDPGGQETQ
jgi:hypothetical protein